MPSADWHAAKELLGRTCRLDGADQRRAIFQASDVDDATRDLAWRLARTRRDLEGRAHLLAQAPPRWAAPTQPHPSAPASEGGLPAPGEIVAGRYELLQEIGCGAHGVVFAARDRLSIREVAIKLVALGCPHQQRRLDRELASLRVSRVRGVAELLDDGREGAWAYIVMALIHGEPFPGPGAGSANPSVVLQRAVALFQALHRLHMRGVLHLDVKPANVLVPKHGDVTLVDLGIAEEQTDGQRWASEVELFGTPLYMAPERLLGACATRRSDVYSAARTVLAGLGQDRAEARGEPSDAAAAVALGEAALTECPAEAAAAIRAALELDPDRRPATAAEVADAILRSLRGATASPTASRGPRLGRVDLVDLVVRHVVEGRDLDIVGPAGSGKSRLLGDVAAALESAGVAHALLRSGRATSVNCLPGGEALLVDNADHAGAPAGRSHRLTVTPRCEVRAGRRLEGRAAVHLEFLSRADLRQLVRTSNRLFFCRDRIADLLWERSRGRPARIAAQIAAWREADLVRGDAQIEVDPRDLPRLLESPVLDEADGRGVSDGAELSEAARNLWRVLTWAGCALGLRAIERVMGWRAAVVASALDELADAGHIDRVEGHVHVATPCNADAVLLDGSSAALEERLLAELPPTSRIRVEHLRRAGRHAEACRAALALADELRAAGLNLDAHALVARALSDARRRCPDDVAVYEALTERLVWTSTSTGTQAAIDLARYHVELTPRPGPLTSAWRAILAAAARVIAQDPQGALDLLDGNAEPTSRSAARLWHIVAALAAQRVRSVTDQRARLGRALHALRPGRTRTDRSLISAWTGWLRFHEGRYEVAASLHARAARLAVEARPRVTALCNAATAALDACQLDAAARYARQASQAATALRDTVNLARAERLERMVAYRLGVALAVDEDLLWATRHLDQSGPAGLTALCEAAIAWRAGSPERGAELAAEARRSFEGTAARAVALLAWSLEVRCRGVSERSLHAALDGASTRLDPVGVVGQAVALVAPFASTPFPSPAGLARLRAHMVGMGNPDVRREVLSPREVLVELGP